MYLKDFSRVRAVERALIKSKRHDGLSRRQLLGASIGAAGLTFLHPSLTLAKPLRQSMTSTGGAPNPIPYVLDSGDVGAIHLHLPTETLGPGSVTVDSGAGDPSTIIDFQGTVGIFEPFGGTGVRISPDGTEEEMWWAADVRFLDGQYIDVDGVQQDGTFAFL